MFLQYHAKSNPTRQRAPIANLDLGLESAARTHHGRHVLFFVGDFAFLVTAGVAATSTMHWIHQLEWPFVPTCVFGMFGAMVVQTLMAFAAAPLLGSIESMVPSMIVAMVSPMTICVLHLFGCESTWAMAAVIGAAFAVVMFTLLQLYGRSCRRALVRECSCAGG